MFKSFKRQKTSNVFSQWHPPASPQAQTVIRHDSTPLGWRAILLRIWLVIAAVWLTAYVGFRIQYVNLSPALAVFSLLVCLAEMHLIIHLYGMFYGLWPRRYQTWEALNEDRSLRCNLFICVCGEPPDVVRETIQSALKAAQVYSETIKPIHEPRVIVLNDGLVAGKDNWQAIEVICAELGAEHIARTTPGGFKAGNINNGLRATATEDPHKTLDIVFDSDFCAKQEFLVEITKPFADEQIDFVQSPQRYKNETTWVAKAAAAHQIFFFDWICPAKGHDNALFLCGTNFAIRREALDAVGGLEERFITEDYATSLELHLAGKRGVFMTQVLALGMAPTSLKQYFTQQKRWSKGNFDVTGAYMKELLFGALTWKQKMHYLLSATYYLIGIRDLILMLAPLPYLYLGESLIRPNSLTFVLYVYAPLFLANTVMYLRMFRFPVKSLILDLVSFPIFTAALVGAIFKAKLGFVVTIKKYERENPLSVYKPQIVVAALLLCGLIYSWLFRLSLGFGSLINYWWACFNTVFLLMGFYLLVVENSRWNVWEATGEKDTAPHNKIAALTAGLFHRPSTGALWRLPRRHALVTGSIMVALLLAAPKIWSQLQETNARARTMRSDHIARPLLAAPVYTRGKVYSAVPVKVGNKVIALSFDDGPSEENTQQILDILKKENVKATFYMIGRQVKALPDLARAVNAAGHDIGNHSWSHAARPAHPGEEVRQTNKIIKEVVGVTATHFRPPMGIMNNGMVEQALLQKHAVSLWSCDPNDWKNTSSDHIVKTVVKQARPGGIVLLHDGGGSRKNTIAALPSIIRELRSRGYRFVTLPELLRIGGETSDNYRRMQYSRG